jgi:hypothetical protein
MKQYLCLVEYCSELLTPQNIIFLEKTIHLVKNFPVFMEPRGSQEPAMGPYPEPFHILISCLRSILILSFHLCLGLLSGLFPLCFMTKYLYTFLISPMKAACPSHLTFLDLFTQNYLVQIISYDSPFSKFSPASYSLSSFFITSILYMLMDKKSSNSSILSQSFHLFHLFLMSSCSGLSPSFEF